MRNVIIETEVQYQLNDLKDYLISIQGERKGKNTFADIMSNIDNLEQFGDVGRNIKEYLLYVHKNYFIFSKTESTITILKMYNNKQDFIYELFGIEMRSQESKDYWGE